MVCNVAGWWTVHAGWWWWWWCTQGGRVVWVVRAGRWTPGGGRARESAAFSDGNVGRRPQVGPPESARIAGWAPGWSREQLDAAEEEDEFALFADRFNDAAINPHDENETKTKRKRYRPITGESENGISPAVSFSRR